MGYRFLENTVLGTPLEEDKYKIIGGGIAGLFLGYFMKNRGWNLKVIEQQARAGGIIATTKNEWGYAEHAANGFMWCKELQYIADDLGLEMLAPAGTAKSKYIVKDRQLKRLPLSLAEIATALWRFTIPHKLKPETVRQFTDEYFGKNVSDNIIDPAMGGIYAADIDDLSFPATMPSLASIQEKGDLFWLNIFRSKGSKPGGRKGTHSFSTGMAGLVEGLEEHLHEELKLHADGLKFIESKEQMVLCLPAYHAANFFKDHEISELLREVKYIPMVSIKIYFPKSGLKGLKEGFGCVIPKNEGFNTIGILFNHDIFPAHVYNTDIYSLTCIMRENYKSDIHPLINMPDEDLKKLLLQELGQIFDISEEPLHLQINKYNRGIPLYSPEHYDNLFKINELLRKDFPHLRLFGNFTGQISIRGMAQQAAKATGFKP